MMTASDVVSVLDCLEGHRIVVWLDGGWGIDALLQGQTRPHDDLDVAVDRESLSAAHAALASLGFSPAPDVRPGLPARLVLHDPAGRQVDFHPLKFDERGDGWQELGDGSWGHYPVDGLRGTGKVGERPVRCTTPELQLQHHLRYEPSPKDRGDMERLTKRFRLPLPLAFDTQQAT